MKDTHLNSKKILNIYYYINSINQIFIIMSILLIKYLLLY